MSEIHEFLGWKPEEGKDGTDDFKTFFGSKYVARDQAASDPDLIKKFEGKRIGAINTAAHRFFGEMIGKNAEDFKTGKLEDLLGDIKEKYEGDIAFIKSKGNEGNDKKLNDLMAQMDEKDKSITAYKSSLTELETQFNGFKESKEGEINQYMVGHQLGEVQSKIPWKDGITEIEKAGFKALIGGSLKLGLDESKKLIVRDSAGNPIPGKKSAAEFATPFEVMTEIAEKNGLIKKNNATNGTTTTVVTPPNGTPERKLSSRYEKMVAKKIK